MNTNRFSTLMNLIIPLNLGILFLILTLAAVTNALLEYNQSKADLHRMKEEHARLLTGQVITGSTVALNADRAMVNRLKEHLDVTRTAILNPGQNTKANSADTLFSISVPDSLEPGEIYLQKLETSSETGKSWFFQGWATGFNKGVVAGVRADHLIKFRRENGLGFYLAELMKHDEVRYALLQDSTDILVSATDFEGNLLSEAEIHTIFHHPDSLFITPLSDPDTLIEVKKAVFLDGTALGIFRIGISVASWDTFSARMTRRLTVAILLWSGLAFSFLLIIYLMGKKEELVRKLEQHQVLEDKAKNQAELAAGVAHELRNPLNAIGTLVQQIDKDFTSTENEEEFHHLLKIVRQETLRMNEKITSFLQFARPAAPVKRMIQIEKWARELEPEFNAIGISKSCKVIISISEKHELLADQIQLTEILRNLVKNAVDSVSEKGLVSVELKSTGSVFRILVEDNGSGIPDDIKSRVFDLYFTTKSDGTGIGLAMVRQMVAVNGGSIRIEDRKPSGTRFILEFPVE